MSPLIDGKNVKDHCKNSFLKGDDVSEDSVIYKIADVNEESMHGEFEQKLVLYFAERERGLVLNKTNTKRLVTLFGDDGNAWIGKRVRLLTEYVDYPVGTTTRVLRIDPKPVPQEETSQPEAAALPLPAPADQQIQAAEF